MTRLCFAGPLPPPVNGFSSVCGMMLDLLKARMPVEVFNRAPGPTARAIGILHPGTRAPHGIRDGGDRLVLPDDPPVE